MIYIAIISVLVILFVLTRYFFLIKEIKRVTYQLAQYNKHKTEKKIDLQFFDKAIIELANQINCHMDLTKHANVERLRTENELKQAIANMSHDIRTPLTSILGYIQLLESDDLSLEKRNEYTSIIKTRAMRLKELLEDFFEISIIEAVDYPVKIERVNLNQLVIEVLVGFYDQFNQQHFEPIINIPEEEIVIQADSSAVKRVLENIISNSIKYSSGNISIFLEKFQSTVRLAISNSATQLNQNDLIFIFDRFYKADKTRSEKGVGLGLAIAKSLMIKMQGNLTAELKDKRLSIICEWKTNLKH